MNPDKERPYNCQGFEWSSLFGGCTGSTAPSGHSYGFNLTTVSVSRCTAGSNCAIGHGHQLPAGGGYTFGLIGSLRF